MDRMKCGYARVLIDDRRQLFSSPF